MRIKHGNNKTVLVSLLAACFGRILQLCDNKTAMAFNPLHTMIHSRRRMPRSLAQFSQPSFRSSSQHHPFSVLFVGLSTAYPSFSTSLNTKTQYTIDDSVCLPTKQETLEKAVHKACNSLDVYLEKKPTAAHTKNAFEILLEMIDENRDKNFNGIILDSGCGTGRSTKLLASSIHPGHLVIGVDRSLARLTKTKDNRQGYDDSSDDDADSSYRAAYCHKVSDNAYLVRAELVDFWRCCVQHGWTKTSTTDDEDDSESDAGGLRITHHYMLYPNPYPTNARLSSRWYAHPSFPLILKLGTPRIVIRSNWEGYLIEFARAVEMANDFYATASSSSNNNKNEDDGASKVHNNLALPYAESAKKGPSERIDKSVALTNFESKYDTVGERTFELILERKK